MADALAVVSLALSSCGGFVDALAIWRDFDNDIDQAVGQFRRLEGVLGSLDQYLRPNASNSHTTMVATAINDCHKGLEQLSTQLRKYKGAAKDAGHINEAKRILRRAVYPLTQTRFKTGGSLVQNLESDLQTTLQVCLAFVIGQPRLPFTA